jgi:hypothetical protein
LDNSDVEAAAAIDRAIETLELEARGLSTEDESPPVTNNHAPLDDAKAADEPAKPDLFPTPAEHIRPSSSVNGGRHIPILPPVFAGAPKQIRTVTVFQPSARGIELGRRAAFETLDINDDQLEAYAALRKEVKGLISGSSNMLGDAEDALRALDNALPENMSDARVFRLWRAGNKLRRLYRAHALVVDQPDGHPAALDPAVAENVGSICEEFNNLAALDPGLRQRDLWRVAPQDAQPTSEEFSSAGPLIQEAIAADVVAPEVIAEISSDGLSPAGPIPDIILPEIDLVNQVRRNFLSALIEGAFEAAKKIASIGRGEIAFAMREIRTGFYSNIGTGAGIAMIMVIVSNNAAISAYAAHVLQSPEAVAAIDWIVKIFGPL